MRGEREWDRRAEVKGGVSREEVVSMRLTDAISARPSSPGGRSCPARGCEFACPVRPSAGRIWPVSAGQPAERGPMLRHVAVVVAVALAAQVGAFAAESIQWKPSLDEAKKEATEKKTFILVYLSSADCPWCRKMEAETLPDAKVIAAVSEMSAVKLADAAAAAFAQKYGLQGVPHTAVLTSDEKLVTAIVGYAPPENFVAELAKAKEKDAKFNELSAKVEANPKDLASVLDLAGALMERRSLPEARKQFIAARALDTEKKFAPRIDLGEGIILAETGDMAGAEKLLSGIPESYAKSPEAPQALYVVGIIQARQKRMEDALKSFKRIADDYKESPWAQAAQRLIQMIMTGAGG